MEAEIRYWHVIIDKNKIPTPKVKNMERKLLYEKVYEHLVKGWFF